MSLVAAPAESAGGDAWCSAPRRRGEPARGGPGGSASARGSGGSDRAASTPRRWPPNDTTSTRSASTPRLPAGEPNGRRYGW